MAMISELSQLILPRVHMNYCHTKLPQYSFIAVSSLLRGKILHHFILEAIRQIEVLIRFWVTYFPGDTKRSCGEKRVVSAVVAELRTAIRVIVESASPVKSGHHKRFSNFGNRCPNRATPAVEVSQSQRRRCDSRCDFLQLYFTCG